MNVLVNHDEDQDELSVNKKEEDIDDDVTDVVPPNSACLPPKDDIDVNLNMQFIQEKELKTIL